VTLKKEVAMRREVAEEMLKHLVIRFY